MTFPQGAVMALCAAMLFGASTPFAKLLLGELDAWLLAGLLYLGSGIGLALAHLRRVSGPQKSEQKLGGRDWLWLGAAVCCGGIVGPVLLMLGLAASSASAASLLLTLEGVFTALLAWFVFHENFDRRIAVGMLAITAGAAVLAWPGLGAGGAPLAGSLLVAGACLAWALDNNFTRKVALNDPVQVAMIKGLVAGSSNSLLAFLLGAALPPLAVAAPAMLVGFLGYGVSLALFVLALRHIGTARTGAYFSVAPFIGAAISIPLLSETVTVPFIVAGVLMAAGVWLHLTERHEHEHEHEPMAHTHLHYHDEHHQHDHDPGMPATEPHTHYHVHAQLRHRHPHYPDAHHRHRH